MPAEGPPDLRRARAVLNAAGLFFIVFGILQSGTYGWLTAEKDFTVGGVTLIQEGGLSPVWLLVAIGMVILAAYFLYAARLERRGGQPLLSPRLFRNRTSNLGLTTQGVQWLILQGSFFVVSVFLQTVGASGGNGLDPDPGHRLPTAGVGFCGPHGAQPIAEFLIRRFVIWIAGIRSCCCRHRGAKPSCSFGLCRDRHR
jgi:hypothetical protein